MNLNLEYIPIYINAKKVWYINFIVEGNIYICKIRVNI